MLIVNENISGKNTGKYLFKALLKFCLLKKQKGLVDINVTIKTVKVVIIGYLKKKKCCSSVALRHS